METTPHTKTLLPDDEYGQFLSMIVKELASTAEFRAVATGLARRLLADWSAHDPFNRLVAGRVEKWIIKELATLAEQNTETHDCWKDPEMAAAMAQGMAKDVPLLINAIIGTAVRLSEGRQHLPPECRRETFQSTLKGINTGLLGRWLTLQIRSFSDLTANPEGFAEAMEDPIRNLIASIDFGELKEAMDGSEEAIVASVRMVNTTIWDYPAKFICLASLLPTVANIILRSARETLVPLHAQAPDVLADVVFSLLRSLNGKAAGDLVNGLAEVIRQTHTGSALIGDQGLPQFGADLRILLADFASALNPEVIIKARTALAEDMETIRNAWTETIAERPDLFLASLRHSADRRNPQIRATRREVDLLADLPKDEVNEAISAGLSDLDTQELGETINTVLRLLNSLRHSHPEALPSVLAGVAATIDTDELKEAASWIVPSAVTAVKPLAGVVMPPLIRGLAELLTPEPGDDMDETAGAIAQLKTALRGVKP
ncbi:MAG: hypothetical protein ACYDGO_11660 [Smithellaceae bacterium]